MTRSSLLLFNNLVQITRVGCVEVRIWVSQYAMFVCFMYMSCIIQALGSRVSCVQCALVWEVVPLSSVEPKRFAQLWVVYILNAVDASLLLPFLFLLLVPLYFSSPSLYFLSPFLPPPSPYLCRSRILSSMERQKGLSRSSCTNHEGETLSLDVSWTLVTTVPRGLSMAKVHRWRRYVIGLFLSSVTSCLLISVTSYLLIFVISCSLIGVTFWHCLSVAKMCMTWSISQIWALLVNTSNGRQ